MAESGPKTDDEILNELFGSVASTIEDLVTREVQQGRRPDQLAVMLERRADGEVVGDCGLRLGVVGRIRGDERLPVPQRVALAESVMSATGNEVPTVLFAHHDGYLVVGSRRLSGSAVTLN